MTRRRRRRPSPELAVVGAGLVLLSAGALLHASTASLSGVPVTAVDVQTQAAVRYSSSAPTSTTTGTVVLGTARYDRTSFTLTPTAGWTAAAREVRVLATQAGVAPRTAWDPCTPSPSPAVVTSQWTCTFAAPNLPQGNGAPSLRVAAVN